MRSGGKALASWRLLLLATVMVLWSAVVRADDKPKMSATPFENLPESLHYFEDSDVILYFDGELFDSTVYRSDDAGFSWETVEDIPRGDAVWVIMHRFEPQTAFVLTDGWDHYKTTDRGKTWTTFTSKVVASYFLSEILVFHADDPDRIIFNGMVCEGIFCTELAMFTTDGFKSVHLLRDFTAGCWWARSTKEFTTTDKDLDKDRTLCIVPDPLSMFNEEQSLHISDSYFHLSTNDEIDEFEPDLDGQGSVDGVVNLAVVKGYILVASSPPSSDEMTLYVTNDTLKWHQAMFPKNDDHDHSHHISQMAYTVLESTNHSIQIDVMNSHPSTPMGVLFTSNSDGDYFIENVPYTNRNDRGHVDFEQIAGIQGVYLVNTVKNGPAVDRDGESKRVESQITYNGGWDFEKIYTADGDQIHLHSETELDNVGRVFSSPAPGLVMGNGNTGDYLEDFDKSNLFVSDNAGLTWTQALEGPHKYEFGDSGGILVAIKDSISYDVGSFSYSLNHGKDWTKVNLPDDLKIKPAAITTTQDSTSLKFIIVGVSKDGDEKVPQVIAVDFDSLDKRDCKSDDMEDWHARVDDEGNPTCVMGHKQTYRRRKKDADCFMRADFEDPVPIIDNCECTEADFECDFNFERDLDDKSKCNKVGPIAKPDGVCDSDPEATFQGTSGWRLIPGNTCIRGDGPQMDDPVERKCSEVISAPHGPGSGEVERTPPFKFDTNLANIQKIYLGNSGGDEVVIARPFEDSGDGDVLVGRHVWMSRDHGKNWTQILEEVQIMGIFPHPHIDETMYFTTDEKKVFYTINGGKAFHSFEAPTVPPIDVLPLSFHPEQRDWLIWIGKSCDGAGGTSCHLEASLSTDRGDNWRTIRRYVKRCEFTGNKAFNRELRPQKQILCLGHAEESNDADWTVISSNDFFEDAEKLTFFKGGVENFATMSEFIVLAGKDSETNELHAYASMDGVKFEQAQFPDSFHEGHDAEYTVLDSSSHAINLFVRKEGAEDREYGSIVKSNSNGTSYVVSATEVNCDAETYVDFEKVPGIEGITLINVVANAGSESDKTKKLQTKISHNAGHSWGYLPPPAKNADGEGYGCSGSGDGSCALHLHHYTEREDKKKSFAASTAVGLMMGVGNVGSSLGDIDEADTFLTPDAGLTWKNVKKGRWMWQYGDQGSIIVLVQKATRSNPVTTKIVSYSLDEGKTWTDYEFSNEEMTVLDITTLRSGTSRNFILWCKSSGGDLSSINLDFSGLTDDECDDEDYVPWSPSHPLQSDNCLFGHVASYLRKKPDSKCFNKKSLSRVREFRNCECQRVDYECDFNYQLDNHGQCSLVPEHEPISGQEWCKQNPNATSWFEPTGYRRIPLSTCEGGKELDKTSTEHPCEGYEDEFEERHRTSGVAIFFAVIIPVALASAIGWYVYRNWNGKFGQIRLGEQSASFDSDQPWIKYPVIAVSAVVAAGAAVPLVLTAIWRSMTGGYQGISGGGGRNWFSSGPRRFTTRDSFARGRPDYSMVDEDEGELLGEDSDEEV